LALRTHLTIRELGFVFPQSSLNLEVEGSTIGQCPDISQPQQPLVSSSQR